MTSDTAGYPSLRGKVCLVTGGASGIGAAIAAAFADQGSLVAIVDRDEPAGRRLVEEIGDHHTFVPCDVRDPGELSAAVDDIARRFGRLDVVVANAADDSRHSVSEATPELWRESMGVNLDHQFFLARAAEPYLAAAGGGSIICLGSISWRNNTTGMVAYTTAKAGVHGLVRTLARLWGGAGIRVNALVPGWTMTERQVSFWVDDSAEREIEAGQCLPGRVLPGDVARAALFLASDDAAMITQQELVVDGGWV